LAAKTYLEVLLAAWEKGLMDEAFIGIFSQIAIPENSATATLNSRKQITNATSLDELRDVTKVMTKNIEDLLYRGDSLERMNETSSRLREDARKYKKAAVRINWELLLKQYGPIGGLAFFILLFLYWRFFW